MGYLLLFMSNHFILCYVQKALIETVDARYLELPRDQRKCARQIKFEITNS